MFSQLTISAIALSLLALSSCTNAGVIDKRQIAQPIMNGINFPDPSVIRVTSGWHLFSTNAWSTPSNGSVPAPQVQPAGSKLIHVQRAFTSDWKTFTYLPGVDALPSLPSWAIAVNPRVWAPDVVRLDDGTFVMYYSVAMKNFPRKHCLSYATAKTITEPFVDNSTAPFICPDPMTQGGAIDVAGYTDETRTGSRYIVYKVDGNAIGHGGNCGNTVAPIVPTPIMLQQVGPDGVTLIGSPVQILTNIPSDGPYVEAPALTYMNGRYVLFFSSKCYTTPGYDVQYAIADRITGPYVRSGTLFATGVQGMVAPGSMDVAINGERAIWHGNFGGGRAAYVASLKLENGVVTATF
ncbi:hypothetical protein CLAFUW4_12137 [Fulvia fulva]|uniref:Glycoside hydrolase family 43 protein n=1 Tax=Passalora fulva TaxID=5499 RepID=A0A9Q8PEZ4_PASFU|nr:uncharacterized protein CLAFUR5_11176 [Fulvia fulva]KAK4617623.1 hypothetical protein CLAFUR4_12142 [Fulvia fulva]KAK4618581.1 hypothetical protein CLAFUR0_12153 [Fulvia fulva]UJO21238.1 hypothetical protein CLAFUR5_11176 [Fulvia fulva]WPV18706.1 hypothetical protein CLAFUW4_12137 [Fulvia fulva]WPV33390.1 hypothetical protein CLAFUW7_12144 [Fulvia fulva]